MSDETEIPTNPNFPNVGGGRQALSLLARYGTIGGLFVMIGVFSILSPMAFPTVYNFTNVLNQASLAMIIAGGLTMAVIVGELDLSIGFVASMSGVLVTGLIIQTGLPIPLAFAAVFLGSATLRDGEFHVLGTLIGVLIIAFGFNGLNIFGAPTYSQYILQGTILVMAVGLSSLGRVLSEK